MPSVTAGSGPSAVRNALTRGGRGGLARGGVGGRPRLTLVLKPDLISRVRPAPRTATAPWITEVVVVPSADTVTSN
ncbi:MAG: hypothetical protein QF521_20150, partial [Alphaproteobacteria bacterium]|nr:hypothetical protein [Alphaproteobacteria bacterium]